MARPVSSTPSLTRIAKELGISVATASRAIRNAQGVGAETRERVLEAVRRYGYAVPQRRGAADEPRMHHVMVLSQATQGSDWNYLSGMSRAAIPLKLMLLVHHTSADTAADVAERARQPMAMQEGMVDGLVFLRRWPSEIVARLSAQTPAVSVVHHYPGCATDFVGIDDRTGMALIVNHLLRAGYKKIGFFGLCSKFSWSRSRHAAYIEALNAAGAPLCMDDLVRIANPEGIAVEGSSSVWGEQVRARIKAGVDAWICASEGISWDFVRFLLQSGIRVPEKVGVTGYHRNAPDPKDLPALTSVEISDEELGATALRMLVHRFEYPREAVQSLSLAPKLLARATTRGERT